MLIYLGAARTCETNKDNLQSYYTKEHDQSTAAILEYEYAQQYSQLSIQRGNVSSILGTLPPSNNLNEIFYL